MVEAAGQILDALVEAAAEATFSSWKPRQIASSGTPAATAARISGRVVESRAGSSGVPSAWAGALVVVRADVGAAAGEDQPVQPRQDARHQRLAGGGEQHGMPSTGPSTART
jgi:hypothetical protein